MQETANKGTTFGKEMKPCDCFKDHSQVHPLSFIFSSLSTHTECFHSDSVCVMQPHIGCEKCLQVSQPRSVLTLL